MADTQGSDQNGGVAKTDFSTEGTNESEVSLPKPLSSSKHADSDVLQSNPHDIGDQMADIQCDTFSATKGPIPSETQLSVSDLTENQEAMEKVNKSTNEVEGPSIKIEQDDSVNQSRELKLLLALSKEARLETNLSRKRKSLERKKQRYSGGKSSRIQYPVTAEAELEMELQNTEIAKLDNKNEDNASTTPVAKSVKRKKSMLLDSSGDNSTEEQLKKIRKSLSHDATVFKPNKDMFCWRCHKDSVNISCETCPRSYHQRCLKQTINDPNHWPCPECVSILKAESTQTRSPAMRGMTLEHLCSLLKFAANRMIQCQGSEPFIHAVNDTEFPEYRKYIIQPMDLTLLEKNIKENLYGSTQAFEADAKWILHNSIIFNSYQSKLTSVAKGIIKVCKQEMAEIENCPSCYLNANTKKNTWFIEVCPKPHLLVWAKLRGFPFWPGKAMSCKDGLVDVRFFGAHDRAWVPEKECFLYSPKDPNAFRQKRADIEQCVEELEVHVENLKKIYGEFHYPPFKTNLDPENEVKQLQMFLPRYRPGHIRKQYSKSRSTDIDKTEIKTLSASNSETKQEKTKAFPVSKVVESTSKTEKSDNNEDVKVFVTSDEKVDNEDEIMEGYGTDDESIPEIDTETRKNLLKKSETDSEKHEAEEDDTQVPSNIEPDTSGVHEIVLTKGALKSYPGETKIGPKKSDSEPSSKRQSFDDSSPLPIKMFRRNSETKTESTRLSDRINRVDISENMEFSLGNDEKFSYSENISLSNSDTSNDFNIEIKKKPVQVDIDNVEFTISPARKVKISDKLMKRLSDEDITSKEGCNSIPEKVEHAKRNLNENEEPSTRKSDENIKEIVNSSETSQQVSLEPKPSVSTESSVEEVVSSSNEDDEVVPKENVKHKKFEKTNKRKVSTSDSVEDANDLQVVKTKASTSSSRRSSVKTPAEEEDGDLTPTSSKENTKKICPKEVINERNDFKADQAELDAESNHEDEAESESDSSDETSTDENKPLSTLVRSSSSTNVNVDDETSNTGKGPVIKIISTGDKGPVVQILSPSRSKSSENIEHEPTKIIKNAKSTEEKVDQAIKKNLKDEKHSDKEKEDNKKSLKTYERSHGKTRLQLAEKKESELETKTTKTNVPEIESKPPEKQKPIISFKLHSPEKSVKYIKLLPTKNNTSKDLPESTTTKSLTPKKGTSTVQPEKEKEEAKEKEVTIEKEVTLKCSDLGTSKDKNIVSPIPKGKPESQEKERAKKIHRSSSEELDSELDEMQLNIDKEKIINIIHSSLSDTSCSPVKSGGDSPEKEDAIASKTLPDNETSTSNQLTSPNQVSSLEKEELPSNNKSGPKEKVASTNQVLSVEKEDSSHDKNETSPREKDITSLKEPHSKNEGTFSNKESHPTKEDTPKKASPVKIPTSETKTLTSETNTLVSEAKKLASETKVSTSEAKKRKMSTEENQETQAKLIKIVSVSNILNKENENKSKESEDSSLLKKSLQAKKIVRQSSLETQSPTNSNRSSIVQDIVTEIKSEPESETESNGLQDMEAKKKYLSALGVLEKGEAPQKSATNEIRTRSKTEEKREKLRKMDNMSKVIDDVAVNFSAVHEDGVPKKNPSTAQNSAAKPDTGEIFVKSFAKITPDAIKKVNPPPPLVHTGVTKQSARKSTSFPHTTYGKSIARPVTTAQLPFTPAQKQHINAVQKDYAKESNKTTSVTTPTTTSVSEANEVAKSTPKVTSVNSLVASLTTATTTVTPVQMTPRATVTPLQHLENMRPANGYLILQPPQPTENLLLLPPNQTINYGTSIPSQMSMTPCLVSAPTTSQPAVRHITPPAIWNSSAPSLQPINVSNSQNYIPQGETGYLNAACAAYPLIRTSANVQNEAPGARPLVNGLPETLAVRDSNNSSKDNSNTERTGNSGAGAATAAAVAPVVPPTVVPTASNTVEPTPVVEPVQVVEPEVIAENDDNDEFRVLNSLIPENISRAVSEIIRRPPPKLKPRPPGILSQQFSEGIPSSAGPVTTAINSVAHRLGDYFRGMLIETLEDLGKTSNQEATITNLKLEIESLKHKHTIELSEIEKNMCTILRDIQRSIVEDREKVIEETRAACEAEAIKRVEEAKSKQWCASCSKEAQFFCCWNTSYCDYPCQQKHWPSHMGKCTQSMNQGPHVAPSATMRPASQQLILRPANPPPKGSIGRVFSKPIQKVYMNRATAPKTMRVQTSTGLYTMMETTPGNYQLMSTPVVKTVTTSMANLKTATTMISMSSPSTLGVISNSQQKSVPSKQPIRVLSHSIPVTTVLEEDSD